MPGGIKISKPERLPKEDVSETDLLAWWNELNNYLNQDEDFELFKQGGIYAQWEPAELDENRITVVMAPDNETALPKRRRQLNNFLTIIAGCCSKDQYMHIIKQATSLKWIWNELTLIYQHQHKGKDFLSIIDIEWNPPHTSAMTVYNSYRAKVMENLKPKNTVLQWKNDVMTKQDEVISPTFEDHILLTVLCLINKGLPAKVKEIYGPRMERGKFLMDFKSDILSNVNKMLEDLEQENHVNKIQYDEEDHFQAGYISHGNFRGSQNRRFSGYRGNTRTNARGRTPVLNKKFCRLCHLTRQPNRVIMSHAIGDFNCPSLSNRDKDDLRSRVPVTATVEINTEEEELEMMAQLHGYGEDNTDQVKKDLQFDNVSVKPVKCQVLSPY